MYLETVDNFADVAAKKSSYLKRSPGAFWVSAMMAGAYVGLGILLIFSIGSDADPAYRGLIMGASFGIALILVIFAGSELFTGHTMFMTIGWLRRRIGLSDLAAAWVMSWLGNIVGCAVLAMLFVAGGGAAVLHSKSQFFFAVAAAKMNAPVLSLFARAILCNWLVCLAIWMSSRMTNDTAKIIGIAWCLFGFIGSGYEHSVANMTLFLVALFADHPATITWGGLAYNLFWVTLSNIVAGAGIMGLGYTVASAPATAMKPMAAEMPLAAD